MILKRNESFRYSFTEPISAYFSITKIDNQAIETAKGEARMINISPEGMKLTSKLNVPDVNDKSIQLSIYFRLNEKELSVDGLIIWKKARGKHYEYGVHLIEETTEKQQLIDELKQYVKK